MAVGIVQQGKCFLSLFVSGSEENKLVDDGLVGEELGDDVVVDDCFVADGLADDDLVSNGLGGVEGGVEGDGNAVQIKNFKLSATIAYTAHYGNEVL